MKLKIEQMVIPFKYAVYLKKKGVKQQSLFYWAEEPSGKYRLVTNKHLKDLIRGKDVPDINIPENAYSAFLTDEISFILIENKSFNLDKTNIEFQYKETHHKRNFWDIFSFGAELVQAFIFNERDSKYLREKQPHQAPKSPKNPNTNGNFR